MILGHKVVSIMAIALLQRDWAVPGDTGSCSGCLFSRATPGNLVSFPFNGRNEGAVQYSLSLLVGLRQIIVVRLIAGNAWRSE